MRQPAITLIAAVARDGGMGLHGALLVRIADDLCRLKALTMGAPIVMGRKTWDSIGRPLPGRRNIVVSRDRGWQAEGAEAATSLEAALLLAGDAERVFILGGAEIYALALPIADRLELTEIDAVFPADAYFPSWDRACFRRTARDSRRTDAGLAYAFTTYQRILEND